ncbi:hypothetical protein VT84_14435 [Gemmata sp. SH-PL17]|uniref:hypothetical protein n=1 Tax=Gemmata sp. SH-PL17 TaxID=1630693 RepID=UPI00078B95A1|nr:hypothetical protein [Gemmata sp. SH-PL17]AMV25591.1 hypothetical protein VT84_14435 [Gemmata sp. SH-PL17]
MTITLHVRKVLHDPTPFVKGFRLAVDGALLLSNDDFRIYQADESGLEDELSLWIDDPLAATKVREALPQPPPSGWWYFGRALVQAWTRHDPGGWVLHEVISVWLEELGERPVSIKVRPHPWGWDRLG